MNFTVLGSGSCELNPERSSPAHLVTAGRTMILLDAGQGALRRLLSTGRDPAGLNGILLSHHHLDHLADVLPFLFALNYDQRLKREASVVLAGHRELERVFRGLELVFGHWVRPEEANLTTRFLEPGEGFSLGGVNISTAQASHLNTSLAWRLEAGGKSLAYLGDSEATDGLAHLARGVDLLVVDCAASDEKPKKGHLGPTQSGLLAQKAGAGRLLLCHFYREVDPETARAQAAKVFSGEVIAARDLLTVEL